MPGVIFCMGPTDQCPKAGLSHTLAAERRCDHIVTIGGIGSAASYLITLFGYRAAQSRSRITSGEGAGEQQLLHVRLCSQITA